MAGFLTELVTEIIGEVAGIFTASQMGWLGKITGKVISNDKVKETIAKKFEDIIGVDKSGKTLEEELLTIDLVNALEGNQPQEVDNFVTALREQERGEEKIVAFRVFLASGIKKGSRKTKEFIPNPAAGGKGKPTEQVYELLDIGWGKTFIARFLSRANFNDRVKFLDDQGVFSTMKKKGEPNPVVRETKKFFNETSRKITNNQQTNFSDLQSFAETANANAKQRLQDALNRRRS